MKELIEKIEKLNFEELLANHQTSFIASEIKKLMAQQKETLEMIELDESMRDIAQEELKNIEIQLRGYFDQINSIRKALKEEEEFPNEIV